MDAHLQLLLQQVAAQEDVLLKTVAPNLRALENLKAIRDKFQESTDGEAGLPLASEAALLGLWVLGLYF